MFILSASYFVQRPLNNSSKYMATSVPSLEHYFDLILLNSYLLIATFHCIFWFSFTISSSQNFGNGMHLFILLYYYIYLLIISSRLTPTNR